MDKKQLRDMTKEKLINLDENTRKEVHQKLVEHLFESDLWKNASTIGVTISAGFEWDTESIIERAWQDGKTIAVPKCVNKPRALHFYELTSFDELEVVYYGLREPNPEKARKVEKQEIDLLIVPGIVFDNRGYRVGFGGGFYDRYLVDFENETVSLFYSEQLIDEVPAESYDMAVKSLITEEGFIKK